MLAAFYEDPRGTFCAIQERPALCVPLAGVWQSAFPSLLHVRVSPTPNFFFFLPPS